MSEEKLSVIEVIENLGKDENRIFGYQQFSLGKIEDALGKSYMAIGFSAGDIIHPTLVALVKDKRFSIDNVILYMNEKKCREDWEKLRQNLSYCFAMDLMRKRDKTPTVARILK